MSDPFLASRAYVKHVLQHVMTDIVDGVKSKWQSPKVQELYDREYAFLKARYKALLRSTK